MWHLYPRKAYWKTPRSIPWVLVEVEGWAGNNRIYSICPYKRVTKVFDISEVHPDATWRPSPNPGQSFWSTCKKIEPNEAIFSMSDGAEGHEPRGTSNRWSWSKEVGFICPSFHECLKWVLSAQMPRREGCVPWFLRVSHRPRWGGRQNVTSYLQGIQPRHVCTANTIITRVLLTMICKFAP